MTGIRFVFATFCIALLWGCPGSIKTDRAENFGSVSSATWFDVISDDGDNIHFITLSNVSNLCGKVDKIADDVNDILIDFGEDLLSNPFSACGTGDDVYEEINTFTEDIFRDGARFLDITLTDGNDGLAEPKTDDYEVEGDNERYDFSMYFYEEDPVLFISTNWNSNTCGLGIDLDDTYDMWRAGNPGTLDLKVNNAETRVTGDLVGDIEESDGDDDGEIEVSFSASRCIIELSGDAIAFPTPTAFAL